MQAPEQQALKPSLRASALTPLRCRASMRRRGAIMFVLTLSGLAAACARPTPLVVPDDPDAARRGIYRNYDGGSGGY